MTDADLSRLVDADRLLVALDFDGTLAPLMDEPMKARMLPVAREAVDALVATPDTVVALVSGRSLDDLRVIAEHDDDSPLRLAGSHGAELWLPGTGEVPADDDPADIMLRDELRERAEVVTAHLDGVWIEPKRYGFAVHTRLADPETGERGRDAVDAIVRANAPHWRRRTGHNIAEYAFRHEGKDAAVAALREREGADAALFAGDDVTDEDALRSLGDGDVGVRVGDGATAATVRVADIPAMAALLSRLAAERTASRRE